MTSWTDIVSRFVVGTAIAVILLGVGRELLVAFVGTGAVLQEGRHFDLGCRSEPSGLVQRRSSVDVRSSGGHVRFV
ncbi:MAG: hypothetical protein ACTSWI_00635 [Alphaproteobacteria bacterium]